MVNLEIVKKNKVEIGTKKNHYNQRGIEGKKTVNLYIVEKNKVENRCILLIKTNPENLETRLKNC